MHPPDCNHAPTTALHPLPEALGQLQERLNSVTEALEACKSRFGLVSQAVEGLIVDWDLRTGICLRSDNLELLLGHAPLDVPYTFEWFRTIVHPDDLPKYDRAVDDLVHANHRQLKVVVRCLHGDGQYRHVRAHGIAVRDPHDDALQRVVVCYVDAGKDNATQQALEESEQRYRLATESFEGITFEWDLATGRFYRSANVTAVLGYDPKDVDPTLEWGKNLQHPEDAPRFQREVNRFLIADDRTFTTQVRLRHKSGEYRWVRVHAIAVRDAASRPLKVYGCYVDITELVQGEAERHKIARQLQETQKLESLGVLAGGIAHDFNNLLMVIQGNLALLKSELGSASATSGLTLVQQAEQAGQHAADLCRQLLAYAGRGKLENRPLELTALVNSSRALIQSSVTRQARLVFHLAAGLPNMAGDSSQIRQVILNLVHNAADALSADDGLIELSTGLSTLDSVAIKQCLFAEALPAGQYLWLDVRDTGKGIAEDVRNRIFEPFFSTKFTGRGLGLAAVAGIVKSHRGAIAITSSPQRGASFRVYFPVDASSRLEVMTEGVAEQPIALKRAAGTVLVVDDEPLVRMVIVKLLARRGFSVLEAQDGEEALDILQHHADSLALMILDLTMPRKDGLSTLKEMRLRRHATPVIVVSGYYSTELLPQLADLDADYLAKPFQAADLMTLIDKKLNLV